MRTSMALGMMWGLNIESKRKTKPISGLCGNKCMRGNVEQLCDAHMNLNKTKTASTFGTPFFPRLHSHSDCMADGRVPENVHANARLAFSSSILYWFRSCSCNDRTTIALGVYVWHFFCLFLPRKAVSILLFIYECVCVRWVMSVSVSCMRHEWCTHR